MTILVNLIVGSAIYALLGLPLVAVLLVAAAPFAIAIGVRRLRSGSHPHGRHAFQPR